MAVSLAVRQAAALRTATQELGNIKRPDEDSLDLDSDAFGDSRQGLRVLR